MSGSMIGSMFGLPDVSHWTMPSPVRVALESDDDLRERLIYVAGDGGAATSRIRVAAGKQLDDIAETLNLRRR